MAPDTAIRPSATPRRFRLQIRWTWFAVAVAAVTFALIVPPMMSSPATVPRVSFVNPTAYALDVAVTSARHDGWTELGTAPPHSTTTDQAVIDEGETFVFHFMSQGQDGGETQVTRTVLRSTGWQVVIPGSVGTTLTRHGASPTPVSAH